MTTQALFEEGEKHWLALSEYSSKHKMSISTLRRRIKANQIPFQLRGGKYYIKNSLPTEHPQTSGPEKPLEATAHRPSKSNALRTFSEPEDSPSISHLHLLKETRKMLSRVEQINTKSLAEKDKQILALQLKISNLQTLIKALEDRLLYLEPL